MSDSEKLDNKYSCADITVPDGEFVMLGSESIKEFRISVPKAGKLRKLSLRTLSKIDANDFDMTYEEMINIVLACCEKKLDFDGCNAAFIISVFKECLPFFADSLSAKSELKVTRF